MSVLTGPEIKRQRALGNLNITPWDDARLGPNSYDLTLDKRLLVYDLDRCRIMVAHTVRNTGDRIEVQESGILDMRKDNPVKELVIPSEGLILEPGVLYLGSTAEFTETPGFAPFIEGRSSVGRLGLSVHVTAGFGDRGFRGAWTLELITTHRLLIFAGVRICQIAYLETAGDVQPYRGKYQNAQEAQASRLWLDTENTARKE